MSMMASNEPAHQLIYMLQELCCAKFLTLNSDIIKCLSSVPDLLEHQPSQFSSLKCLEIIKVQRKRKSTNSIMPNHVRNYLLNGSPNATLIMDFPEEQPRKSRKSRKKVQMGTAGVDKWLEAKCEFQRAEMEAQYDGHKAEMEAQFEMHKAEREAHLMHFEAEVQDMMVKMNSHKISMAKTIRSQPILDPNSISAAVVSPTRQEELRKEVQSVTESIDIYSRLKEVQVNFLAQMEALHERQVVEREAQLEHHKVERKAQLERNIAELMSLSIAPTYVSTSARDHQSQTL